MRPVRAPAGRRTQILQTLSSGPFDVAFTAHALTDAELTGKVEESWRGIAGRSSKIHDLKAENRFRAGLLASGYRVAVIPDGDVEIRFLTHHTQPLDVAKWVGIGFAVLLGLSLIMRAIRAITG